jgi:single-strand DNA-binding protein
MSVNKVTVMGRVGAIYELKYTTGGSAVVNFSVATSDGYTDKDGNRQETTEWHKLAAFGKTAEFVAKYFGKGSGIYLEGKLKTDSFKDKDGVEKEKTYIVAREVRFPPASKKNELPTDTIDPNANYASDEIPF